MASEKKMEEVWKTIPGFEDYEISNKGVVRSKSKYLNVEPWFRKGRTLKPKQTKHGLVATLYDRQNCYRFKLISILMAEAFLEPSDTVTRVYYLDNNAKNIALENLSLEKPLNRTYKTSVQTA